MLDSIDSSAGLQDRSTVKAIDPWRTVKKIDPWTAFDHLDCDG
jgi:hypothetical protein